MVSIKPIFTAGTFREVEWGDIFVTEQGGVTGFFIRSAHQEPGDQGKITHFGISLPEDGKSSLIYERDFQNLKCLTSPAWYLQVGDDLDFIVASRTARLEAGYIQIDGDKMSLIVDNAGRLASLDLRTGILMRAMEPGGVYIKKWEVLGGSISVF